MFIEVKKYIEKYIYNYKNSMFIKEFKSRFKQIFN